MSLPKTYTTAQVAAAFQVSVWTVRRLVKTEKVRPMRLSDSPTAELRWTDSDVRQLENALRPAEPVAAPPGRRRRRRAA